MHDAHRVREAQRVGGLSHYAAGFLGRESVPAPQPGRHGLAVDIGHHEVHEAAGLSDCVDRHYVWVRQAGGRLRLAQEARADLIPKGQVGREDLDGDAALELEVASAIHDPHAAATDLPLDLVGIS